MTKNNFKIKEVKSGIFLAEFKDSYDMCMTFCRYQEYYESPNPKFRNKDFKLFDFIKWYSQHYGKGDFTYTNDWVGFNVPSETLEKCINSVIDWNDYDDVMEDIISSVYSKKKTGDKFYLIGALSGNERTVRHEVAHGMFYLNKEYKKEMLSLVNSLKASFRKDLYRDLEKVGYTKQVLPDEAQAFLGTGWRDYFPVLNGEDKPFIEVFNRYYERK